MCQRSSLHPGQSHHSTPIKQEVSKAADTAQISNQKKAFNLWLTLLSGSIRLKQNLTKTGLWKEGELCKNISTVQHALSLKFRVRTSGLMLQLGWSCGVDSEEATGFPKSKAKGPPASFKEVLRSFSP